ncbi:hypothetical protein CN336_15100 [Bacillus cereus]|nr:hypothetical protein CN336_15100 [Bacillus cereus]
MKCRWQGIVVFVFLIGPGIFYAGLNEKHRILGLVGYQSVHNCVYFKNTQFILKVLYYNGII